MVPFLLDTVITPGGEPAAQAAQSIFTIRKKRMDLITGDAGENVFGAGLKDALEALDAREQAYLELFLGKKITITLAKEILKAYIKLYQKEITIDHIQQVVCQYLDLDVERFNSTERTREIAQARQIAMYLSKQHTKAPLTQIGAAIGGRNHATVLHSCKAVANLMETDKSFRHQVEEIEKLVLAK